MVANEPDVQVFGSLFRRLFRRPAPGLLMHHIVVCDGPMLSDTLKVIAGATVEKRPRLVVVLGGARLTPLEPLPDGISLLWFRCHIRPPMQANL